MGFRKYLMILVILIIWFMALSVTARGLESLTLQRTAPVIAFSCHNGELVFSIMGKWQTSLFSFPSYFVFKAMQ